MKEIFLSVDDVFHGTPNSSVVRGVFASLLTSATRSHQIIWGGPTSLAAILAQSCSELGLDPTQAGIHYRSLFTANIPTNANDYPANIIYTDPVLDDLEESMRFMRYEMLLRPDIEVGVFLGECDEEKKLFKAFHPTAPVALISRTEEISIEITEQSEASSIDFVQRFCVHYQHV